MGDPLDSASDQQAGLFALITYWLNQPAYSVPECQAALMHTLRRLLDPRTSLSAWIRHNAYHCWKFLKPKLAEDKRVSSIQDEIEKILSAQNQAWTELEIRAHRQQAPFLSEGTPRRNSLTVQMHEPVTGLHDPATGVTALTQRRQSYQQAKSIVDTWPDEKQVAFHESAARAHHTKTSDGDPYIWRMDAFTHQHRAAQKAAILGTESVTHQQHQLIRSLLTDLAHTGAQLLPESLVIHSLFAQLLPKPDEKQNQKNIPSGEKCSPGSDPIL